jgi:hypothetical protein
MDKKKAKRKGKPANTLCWSCKNSTGACSWSRKLEPVEGWVAEYSPINMPGGVKAESYFVISCPEFIYDNDRYAKFDSLDWEMAYRFRNLEKE